MNIIPDFETIVIERNGYELQISKNPLSYFRFKGKKAKPPPPPPPTAMAPEESPESKETAIRKARKRGGYSKQIVTGSLAPQTTKKGVLG